MDQSDFVPTGKPFTGKHMIAVIGLFFGTIITVNLIMAYYATSTWSGLVVKNSYVASQEFNGKVEKVKQQEALGYTGKLHAGKGRLSFAFTDKAGAAVASQAVTVLLRRPVTDKADTTVTLARNADGTWSADHVLKDGLWIAVIDATTRDAGNWRQTLRFSVVNGEIR